MSMDIDSPQLLKPKKHKKSKDKDLERSEKKRKRHTSDEPAAASPKKPKNKHRSKSSIAKEAAVISPERSIDSPFYEQTYSLYLPLPPISQRHALQGLCAEHLSPLILTYYPPFHGVIISYSHPRLSTDPDAEESKPAYAKSIDEYAPSFIWLTAEFLVFKPTKGTLIEGYVNLQNESNLGLVCWNFFNASIGRKRLPKGWKWIAGGLKPTTRRKLKKAAESAETDSEEDETDEKEAEDTPEDTQGYFQDENGQKVEGVVRFTVKDVETSRSMDRDTSFLSLEGTMLNDEEERDLQEQEAMRIPERRRRQVNGISEPRNAMSGALMNGHDGAMDIDSTPSVKHRAKY
ncbi:hypothetical protein JMJ35_008652 [Cladonia borealis]|uniref:DNA-directed RNA polymerase subunit n=1 Tax=Cladonia borealis TaxID=184061 RepID=A0AA39QVN7_9LECA|nr:hypothetical protein JMJ35_008652 [Cladonia borealis]